MSVINSHLSDFQLELCSVVGKVVWSAYLDCYGSIHAARTDYESVRNYVNAIANYVRIDQDDSSHCCDYYYYSNDGYYGNLGYGIHGCWNDFLYCGQQDKELSIA